MIGSLQDVTELKQKEEEVRERTKRIIKIARINSHEVRKPLANILGLIELLADSKDNISDLIALLRESSMELDQKIKCMAEKVFLLKEEKAV